MPTLSGDVSRILLFLKAVRYGRHEEMLPEFLLTVKNLSFAPGGPECHITKRGQEPIGVGWKGAKIAPGTRQCVSFVKSTLGPGSQ